MFDPERLLQGMVRNAMGGSLKKKKKGKKGRKRGGLGSMASGMLGTGGKAAVGMGLLGVAIAAVEHMSQKGQQQGQPQGQPGGQPMRRTPPAPPAGASRTAPPPPPSASRSAASMPPPPPAAAPAPGRYAEEEAVLLVKAMVAAAAADGAIDGEERGRILQQLAESGAEQEDRDFVQGLLERPPRLEEITDSVHDVAVARQVYAASLLAIEVDTPEEERYLERLADRLRLPDEEVRQINEQLGLS